MGWDYGRYVFLCRWGYFVGYLNEKEAWEKIMPVARQLQETFGSWQDLADNYLIGRQFWSSKQMQAEGQLFKDAYNKLLTDAESPWKLCAWNLDLNNSEK